MMALFFINNIVWREIDVDERLEKIRIPFLPKLKAMPSDKDIIPAEIIEIKEMIFERTGYYENKARYDLVDIGSTQEMKIHLLITGGR